MNLDWYSNSLVRQPQSHHLKGFIRPSVDQTRLSLKASTSPFRHDPDDEEGNAVTNSSNNKTKLVKAVAWVRGALGRLGIVVLLLLGSFSPGLIVRDGSPSEHLMRPPGEYLYACLVSLLEPCRH